MSGVQSIGGNPGYTACIIWNEHLSEKMDILNVKQATLRDNKNGNFLHISEQLVFTVLYRLYNHC